MSNKQTVDNLFQLLLGRVPTSSEELTFTAEISTNGLESVIQDMLKSAEFQQNFVDMAYTSILKRQADGAGQSFFLSQLQSGASYSQVARYMGNSLEAKQNGYSGNISSNFLLAKMLLKNITGQTPDDNSINVLAKKLDSGTDLASLVSSMVNNVGNVTDAVNVFNTAQTKSKNDQQNALASQTDPSIKQKIQSEDWGQNDVLTGSLTDTNSSSSVASSTTATSSAPSPPQPPPPAGAAAPPPPPPPPPPPVAPTTEGSSTTSVSSSPSSGSSTFTTTTVAQSGSSSNGATSLSAPVATRVTDSGQFTLTSDLVDSGSTQNDEDMENTGRRGATTAAGGEGGSVSVNRSKRHNPAAATRSTAAAPPPPPPPPPTGATIGGTPVITMPTDLNLQKSSFRVDATTLATNPYKGMSDDSMGSSSTPVTSPSGTASSAGATGSDTSVAPSGAVTGGTATSATPLSITAHFATIEGDGSQQLKISPVPNNTFSGSTMPTIPHTTWTLDASGAETLTPDPGYKLVWDSTGHQFGVAKTDGTPVDIQPAELDVYALDAAPKLEANSVRLSVSVSVTDLQDGQ